MSEPKHILLVDDDRDLVDSNRELLEANGYKVSVTYSGAEGIEAAKNKRPDLMILDVMMETDTEGFDVSRRISEIPELKELPMILLTGIRSQMHIDSKFEPDAAWLPVNVVIDKPVAPERLLREVAKQLACSKNADVDANNKRREEK